MRNIITAVMLSALVLTGCKKDEGDKPDTRQASAEKAGAPVTTGSLVDPGTALATVSAGLDVAIKVNQLFGGGRENRDKERLKAAIAVLQQQNAVIINRLGEVLDILRNLGVTIRAGVRDELVTQQKTTLNSNFQLFYETWRAELADPRSGRQARVRYERDILPAVRPLARQLAQPETYGYAHFETVGHALAIEMWISRRVGERFALRREAARTYAEYLQRVLSTTETGSVGYQLASARAQRSRMDSILDLADDRVAQNPRMIVRRNVLERAETRGKCDWEIRVDIEHSVSGNRNNGYQLQERKTNVREERVACDGANGPNCGRCKAFRDQYGVAALQERRDPIDTGDQSLAGRVAYWNEARRVRAAAENDVQVLEKSAQTAQQYLELANQSATTP